MNYLMVMPKSLGSIDHFNIFPIGLAYVSASLKKGGYQVYTANLDYLDGDTYSVLKRILRKNDIDVVCTGGLSRDCQKLKEVIDTARSINPHIVCVVGGGIISSDPEIGMRVLNADIGVIGEGEITMCELARALDSGQSYTDVPGLIYKDGQNSFINTPQRKEIADIDNIPLPDFDGFDYARWVQSSGSGVVLTDRSCPFRCTFCFHPTGSKYRQRSIDNIFNEIEYQIQHYHLKSIGLSSELFATTWNRVEEFCHRIAQYNIPWSCCLRVCDIDVEMLRLMKKSGCVNLVLGLESADNSILKSMRKGITVEQISRALEFTYEADLMIEGGFIFGDINETMESAENTLTYWRRHNDMHYLNLAMITVFPGSFLYDYACKNGIIQDREKFLQDGCPLVNVSKLTDAEYRELTSLITELRLHPHVPAGSVRIKDINPDGECGIEFACRKCKHPGEDRVSFWFGRDIRCPSCGLTNFIDPFQNALHIADAFLCRLPEEPKIALWGAGGIYYKLMQKYDVLSTERFILVDGNKNQQGMTICKKEIHAPEVIQQENIITVIITALSRKHEIHAALREKCPSVKQVLIPAFEVTSDGVVPTLTHIQ